MSCAVFMLLLAVAGLVACAMAATPPAAYGPLPSPRQRKWHELEAYGFVHFTINTFTDKEWGFGDESPSMFSPTGFDADQIARTVKESGMRGLVLTCKHHDGFCLWPSRYTEHSIKNSPWRDGKGDMVREISDACRRYGLQFGVYLSPWDRNHKDYGTPAYVTYYRNQLRELLTEYGPIFEVWFDGANGGDGYYGGARETRRIDNLTYYDWPNTWSIVRELQPDACMFSDAGPDIRWVGNESGFAGEPCWATISPEGGVPGNVQVDLNHGERDGTAWLPAEVDVSIRPGWFYHATEDDAVKSPAKLLDIYFDSVGRGCNLILNLPPDRRGIIHELDVASLHEWRRILADTFSTDLAQGAASQASNIRGGSDEFAPANVLDGNPETYWSTDDDVTTPEMILDLGAPATFDVVCIREYVPLGQRIDAFALDAWDGSQWVQFADGTSIGRQRLVRSAPVTTTKVRLRIAAAPVCPAISEIGLFALPGDARVPEAAAPEQPACAAAGWSIASASSEAPGCEAVNLLDPDAAAFWCTPGGQGVPQEVTIDLGEVRAITGFTFQPRQDGSLDGTPDRYEVSISDDGVTWGGAQAGEFSNIRANPVQQTILLDSPCTGRYLRFVAVRVLDDADHVAVGAIGVVID